MAEKKTDLPISNDDFKYLIEEIVSEAKDINDNHRRERHIQQRILKEKERIETFEGMTMSKEEEFMILYASKELSKNPNARLTGNDILYGMEMEMERVDKVKKRRGDGIRVVGLPDMSGKEPEPQADPVAEGGPKTKYAEPQAPVPVEPAKPAKPADTAAVKKLQQLKKLKLQKKQPKPDDTVRYAVEIKASELPKEIIGSIEREVAENKYFVENDDVLLLLDKRVADIEKYFIDAETMTAYAVEKDEDIVDGSVSLKNYAKDMNWIPLYFDPKDEQSKDRVIETVETVKKETGESWGEGVYVAGMRLGENGENPCIGLFFDDDFKEAMKSMYKAKSAPAPNGV